MNQPAMSEFERQLAVCGTLKLPSLLGWKGARSVSFRPSEAWKARESRHSTDWGFRCKPLFGGKAHCSAFGMARSLSARHRLRPIRVVRCGRLLASESKSYAHRPVLGEARGAIEPQGLAKTAVPIRLAGAKIPGTAQREACDRSTPSL